MVDFVGRHAHSIIREPKDSVYSDAGDVAESVIFWAVHNLCLVGNSFPRYLNPLAHFMSFKTCETAGGGSINFTHTNRYTLVHTQNTRIRPSMCCGSQLQVLIAANA